MLFAPFLRLSPLHHPADCCSSRNANCECYCDGFKRVAFEASLCFVEKLRCRLGAVSCRAPGSYDTVFQHIGYSRYSSCRLVRCVVDLLSHVFEY